MNCLASAGIVLGLLVGSLAAQQPSPQVTRFTSTFSIVAFDPRTEELGVAVQSHAFSVGIVVPWVEPGVGAVATQSLVNPSYGERGLSLMRAGKSAFEALDSLIAEDAQATVRQVAMVDSQGRIAVYTGCKDIPAAGHAYGTGDSDGDLTVSKPDDCGHVMKGNFFSVQANLMANVNVWPAMAKAFQESPGDLAGRMLAALDAAQAAGGDIRGMQSAALIVAKPESTSKPWEDRLFDLRVEDAAEPLKELRRLVNYKRIFNHMGAGDLAIERGDIETGIREFGAAERMASENAELLPSRRAEIAFWHGVVLVKLNRIDTALPLFQKAFKLQPPWREVTPRLGKSGLLPDDPELIKRILEQ